MGQVQGSRRRCRDASLAPRQSTRHLPVFKRDDYVTTHEVEIAHLEERIHVTPGEVLVPFPELERSVKRRTFFANFTHAIGFLIGLPIGISCPALPDEADVFPVRQSMAQDRQCRKDQAG